MQTIAPLWNQPQLKAIWDNPPLQPLYPSDASASQASQTIGQLRTAQQTQSVLSAPIDTQSADRQNNPWTATRTGQSFGEIFQAALEKEVGPAAEVLNPITDLFGAAIDAVKETDATKTQMEYLMATGQLDNPALLSIASTKAQLSVQLLVQLRNRAMDAYNELMRISI